jgi:hypothetical protein
LQHKTTSSTKKHPPYPSTAQIFILNKQQGVKRKGKKKEEGGVVATGERAKEHVAL